MKKLRVSFVVAAVMVFAITFTYYGFSCTVTKHRPPVTTLQDGPVVSLSDVKQMQDILLKHGILFGSAISPADITQRAPRPQNYLTEVAKYFNFYTMSVSYQVLEPRKMGVYNYDFADKTVEFAMANHAKVKGHALVTAASLPVWLTTGNYTPDQLKDILKTHIQTVIKHFKDKYPGQVTEWNVVNEPTCNGGDISKQPGCTIEGIKTNMWSVIHKPGSNDPTDYIQYAFEWAHEADPSAKLFMNEDGIEYISHPKIQRFYNVIKSLVDKHVPINGIGFESHISYFQRNRYSAVALTATMDRFAALGLESQVSEFDVAMTGRSVRVNFFTPTTQIPLENPNNSDFEAQGEVYKMFLEACLNAKNCTGFTTWGPWDGGSYINLHWKGNFYPHLLDDNLKPKLAFKYLVDEAKQHR